MRSLHLFLAALSLFALCLAWSKEDHELFRVRDEFNLLQGEDTNFYKFLGVKPSANLEEINRQHKKRSRQLHPDKAVPALIATRFAPLPGAAVTKGPTQKERAAITKEATDRYALYGVIVAILRDPSQRERYDHFFRNGFPAWRGTGYYFKRYRPGLGTVLVGLLLVFGGAGHYGAMWVGYQRQRKFVEKYVAKARSAAYGSAGVPGISGVAVGRGADTPPQQPEDDEAGPMLMNRRQKRMMEKDDKKKKSTPVSSVRKVRSARDREIATQEDVQTQGPAVTKKRVMAENGKVLIVDSNGNVYLEETNDQGEVQEFLLDPEDIPIPTIYKTAVFRLPVLVYNQTAGRVIDMVRGTNASTAESFLDDEEPTLVSSAPETEQNGATGQNAGEQARNRRTKGRA